MEAASNHELSAVAGEGGTSSVCKVDCEIHIHLDIKNHTKENKSEAILMGVSGDYIGNAFKDAMNEFQIIK